MFVLIKKTTTSLVSRLNAHSNKLATISPITNIYGIARTSLAIGTFITLTVNSPNILFPSIDAQIESGNELFNYINIFFLFKNALWLAQTLSVIILFTVILGWRPRYTGVLHWLVSFSFYKASVTIDGGDQICSILTLLLIPFCLSDSRKWHWSIAKQPIQIGQMGSISLWVLGFIIKLQMCVIYLHAGISKLSVPEWADGTAAYYWFNNISFGASNWFRSPVHYIFSFPFATVIVTWGTILFEIILAMSIMTTRNKYNWKFFLLLGISFHVGIVIIHGLISFYFTMLAGLIMFLVPLNTQINFKNLLKKTPNSAP